MAEWKKRKDNEEEEEDASVSSVFTPPRTPPPKKRSSMSMPLTPKSSVPYVPLTPGQGATASLPSMKSFSGNKNKKLPPSHAPAFFPMTSSYTQDPLLQQWARNNVAAVTPEQPQAQCYYPQDLYHPLPLSMYAGGAAMYPESMKCFPPQHPTPMFQPQHPKNVTVHVHLHSGQQGMASQMHCPPIQASVMPNQGMVHPYGSLLGAPQVPILPGQAMTHRQSSEPQPSYANETAVLEQEIAHLTGVCMQQAAFLSQTSTDASRAQQQQQQWEQNQDADETPYPLAWTGI
jgi:hypothetical protein